MAKFIAELVNDGFVWVRAVADDGSSEYLWRLGRRWHRRTVWGTYVLAYRMLLAVRWQSPIILRHCAIVRDDLLCNLPPEGWEMEVGWFREWCRARFGEEGESG